MGKSTLVALGFPAAVIARDSEPYRFPRRLRQFRVDLRFAATGTLYGLGGLKSILRPIKIMRNIYKSKVIIGIKVEFFNRVQNFWDYYSDGSRGKSK